MIDAEQWGENGRLEEMDAATVAHFLGSILRLAGRSFEEAGHYGVRIPRPNSTFGDDEKG